MSGPAWRLLVDPAADGAWNMAVDEALLERYAGPDAPPGPTLRLYAFHPAALSLGRAQSARGAHDPSFLRCAGIDLVRRPTGGRAVLHERERTYAVIARLGQGPFPSGVLETYRRIAGALAQALAALGADVRIAAPARSARGGRAARSPALDPSCFASASSHEIICGARKLVGSAQLRRRGAFLQHGSIPLAGDPARLAAALGVRSHSGERSAASEAGGVLHEPTSTDLARACGRTVSDHELDAVLVTAFERVLGARLLPGALETDERLRATRLRSWKYDSGSWTLAGHIGERERRWAPAPLGN